MQLGTFLSLLGDLHFGLSWLGSNFHYTQLDTKRVLWMERRKIFWCFYHTTNFSLCVLVRRRLKDNSIFPPSVFRLFHLLTAEALYFFTKIRFHWDSIFPATIATPASFTYLVFPFHAHFSSLFLQKLSLSFRWFVFSPTFKEAKSLNFHRFSFRSELIEKLHQETPQT